MSETEKENCPRCGNASERIVACPKCESLGCVEDCNPGGVGTMCIDCEEDME